MDIFQTKKMLQQLKDENENLKIDLREASRRLKIVQVQSDAGVQEQELSVQKLDNQSNKFNDAEIQQWYSQIQQDHEKQIEAKLQEIVSLRHDLVISKGELIQLRNKKSESAVPQSNLQSSGLQNELNSLKQNIDQYKDQLVSSSQAGKQAQQQIQFQ